MKSALPQQTDITQREGQVRKVPQIRKSPRFSTARTSQDPMTGFMTAAADISRVRRGQVPMSQGKSPHIADLTRNLTRRLPLAFVSLAVGPHPQGLQALQLKRRAACRSLFSECAHSSPELRFT